jgi:hypothetical protein
MGKFAARQTTHAIPHRARADMTQILLVMIAVALGLAFVLGMTIGGTPEERALRIEEQQTLMPWRIASKITGYAVFGIGAKVAVFVMGGYIVFYLIAILRNWLDLRARQVYARNGLFPVIEVQPGELYDPNRDNAGAYPLITMGALAVQKSAATRADRIVVKQTDRGVAPETMPTPPEPVYDWPSRVPLSGLLAGPASLNNLVLGVTLDENGQRHIVNGAMPDLVHVAVGGTSGWGKSEFLKMLACQLLMAVERPDLCMIDLEGVTLNAFAQSERLLYPLADSEPAALALLLALNAEMELRKGLFNAYPGVDRLDRYNAMAGEPLNPIITLIDEATALLDNKNIEGHLKSLTLRARKYGLWLILAGQDWKSSSLDTAIRNQLSTRVQFKALNASQSRVLIGEGDAKDIEAIGRALAVLPGRPMLEMQAPFVSHSMIMDAVRGNGPQRVLDLETIRPESQGEQTARRIIELHGEGLSDTAIAREIFKYGNTHYIAKVREVLQQQQ